MRYVEIMYKQNSFDLLLPELRQFFAKNRSFFYFLGVQLLPRAPQLVHLWLESPFNKVEGLHLC